MPEIFLTSDQHYFHRRICEYTGRPWDSVEEMNAGLVEAHNSTVGKEDTVYILGDFSLGSLEDAMELARGLNGNLKILPGNHEKIHSSNKKKHKFLRAYIDAGFEIMPEDMMLPGTRLRLNHFPYNPDIRHGERYAEYRPVRGRWGEKALAMGHIHQLYRTEEDQFNVGVDVSPGYAPVHVDDVLIWMNSL